MLHVKESHPTASFAGRQEVDSHHHHHNNKSPARPSHMAQSQDALQASALLIVPVYDEQQHGADLVMLPIFAPEEDNKEGRSSCQQQQQQQRKQQQEPQRPQQHKQQQQHRHQQYLQPGPSSSSSRTTTPAAPTPPPKPQLPDGCQDWDHYLAQKKSTMTLPIYLDNKTPLPLGNSSNSSSNSNAAADQQRHQQVRSPELNFNHSFEDAGWRDCINSQRHKQQQQRPHGHELGRRPSSGAATVGCGASLRARRLSTASTLTTMTAATVPGVVTGGGSSSSGMSIRSAKRLSNASTLTTSTTFSSASSSSKKPRGLRRICHSRHLRTYYSEGTSLFIRAASVGGGSLRRHRHGHGRGSGSWKITSTTTGTIKEQREPPVDQQRQQQRRRGVVINNNHDIDNDHDDGCSIKSYKTTASHLYFRNNKDNNNNNKRLSTFSTLSMPVSLTEYSAPPPYPPPAKPLPSVPSSLAHKVKSAAVVATSEVRELHTKERTKWRGLLLKGIQRMDSGRRRMHIGY